MLLCPQDVEHLISIPPGGEGRRGLHDDITVSILIFEQGSLVEVPPSFCPSYSSPCVWYSVFLKQNYYSFQVCRSWFALPLAWPLFPSSVTTSPKSFHHYLNCLSMNRKKILVLNSDAPIRLRSAPNGGWCANPSSGSKRTCRRHPHYVQPQIIQHRWQVHLALVL